jgi:cellulose synthase/poly-beta-1,6-N-acetylglucosamine synthase-like glycosyltransferase
MKIKNWHFCIIIPARNEEKLISRCLHSVNMAAQQLPAFCTYDVILAVDASSDQTFDISNDIIGENGIAFNIDVESVGTARKLATELALQRYKGDLWQCWLANTDADCEIPLQWLVTHLDHALSGTQALAGIISIDNFDEHNNYVPQRFKDSYLLHPDGTHPHIHGANLGVRADAYIRSGGWNCINTAEDHDLWNRLATLSIPMRSDSHCSVITSGRRMGRAPHGFAQALAAHNLG